MIDNSIVPSSECVDVEVCFAAPDRIWQVRLNLAPGSTVGDAIRESEFQRHFPSLSVQANAGIFGKLVTLDKPLRSGDRVEIYRNLIFDPKESRRRRALHRQKNRNIKKKVPMDDLTTK